MWRKSTKNNEVKETNSEKQKNRTETEGDKEKSAEAKESVKGKNAILEGEREAECESINQTNKRKNRRCSDSSPEENDKKKQIIRDTGGLPYRSLGERGKKLIIEIIEGGSGEKFTAVERQRQIEEIEEVRRREKRETEEKVREREDKSKEDKMEMEENMNMLDVKKMFAMIVGMLKDVKEDVKKLVEESVNKVENRIENKVTEEFKKVTAELDKIKEDITELKAWEKRTNTKQEARWLKNGEDNKIVRNEKEPYERQRTESSKQEEKLKKEMEWMVEEKERERRRNNIVIIGLRLNEVKVEGVEKWLEEKLEVKTHIKKWWKINGRKPKIGLKLESREEKENIMRNKNKLGNTPIYIENDTTWKERRNKEIVWIKAKELESREEFKGKKAKIGYNWIRIEEDEWIWSEKQERWWKKRKEMQRGDYGKEIRYVETAERAQQSVTTNAEKEEGGERTSDNFRKKEKKR